MLFFKKKFLDAIRRGEKTQTIRIWPYRRMKAGQKSYIPGIGHIRIEAVAPAPINELTDADAIPDGFPTADSLRDELREIYEEKLKSGGQPFRVTFSVVQD